MYRYIRAILLISLLLITFTKAAKAQVDPGEDPDAPIDGGLGILIAAGVGYGVKKFRDAKKMHTDQSDNK